MASSRLGVVGPYELCACAMCLCVLLFDSRVEWSIAGGLLDLLTRKVLKRVAAPLGMKKKPSCL